MALSETQFMALINGVRSVCDELLRVTPDPSEAVPAAPPAANPLATPPGAAAPPETPAANPLATPPGDGAPPPVTVDTEGIPWDVRIHTAKKSKLKSGVWRLKPGADPVLVAKVKTELTLAAQAAAPAAPPATAPAAPPAANPPEAPPGANPPVEGGMTWSDLLNKIVGANKTPDEVLGACTACGVENIGKLQDSPELIPNVAMVLGLQ